MSHELRKVSMIENERGVVIDFGLNWEAVQVEGVTFERRVENGITEWRKWVKSEPGSSMGSWQAVEDPTITRAENES